MPKIFEYVGYAFLIYDNLAENPLLQVGDVSDRYAGAGRRLRHINVSFAEVRKFL